MGWDDDDDGTRHLISPAVLDRTSPLSAVPAGNLNQPIDRSTDRQETCEIICVLLPFPGMAAAVVPFGINLLAVDKFALPVAVVILACIHTFWYALFEPHCSVGTNGSLCMVDRSQNEVTAEICCD